MSASEEGLVQRTSGRKLKCGVRTSYVLAALSIFLLIVAGIAVGIVLARRTDSSGGPNNSDQHENDSIFGPASTSGTTGPDTGSEPPTVGVDGASGPPGGAGVPPVSAPAVAPMAAGVAPGSWNPTMPQLPAALGEVAAGVITFQGQPHLVAVGQERDENAGSHKTAIFDFSTGAWALKAGRPYVGNHHAAETINNELYLFGGLDEGANTIQIGALVAEAGGGVSIAWREGAAVPFPSGSASTAYIDGLVYYCGGIEVDGTGDDLDTISTCGAYNPTTDSWLPLDSVPPMLAARNHAAACTDGAKMFVFGGRAGGNIVGTGFDDSQVYDPLTGAWANLSVAPLPLPRGGMGKAVYHNGKCYIFGGEVNGGFSADDGVNDLNTVFRVDVFDIATSSWSSAADMPEGMHGIFPVKYGDNVYVAGGGIQAAASESANFFVFSLV